LGSLKVTNSVSEPVFVNPGTPATGQLLSRNVRNHGGNTKNKKKDVNNRRDDIKGRDANRNTGPQDTATAPKTSATAGPTAASETTRTIRKVMNTFNCRLMLTTADTNKNSDANNSTTVSNNELKR
jgi:hypothetical protein